MNFNNAYMQDGQFLLKLTLEITNYFRQFSTDQDDTMTRHDCRPWFIWSTPQSTPQPTPQPTPQSTPQFTPQPIPQPIHQPIPQSILSPTEIHVVSQSTNNRLQHFYIVTKRNELTETRANLDRSNDHQTLNHTEVN